MYVASRVAKIATLLPRNIDPRNYRGHPEVGWKKWTPI
jgi:hypothetical protein